MSGAENKLDLPISEKRALLAELLREKAAKTRQVPLSFAQQRLWFLDQLDPGSASYNISRAVRLKGELNLPALRQALNSIVGRHESLRTNFTSIEGEPVQIIATTREIEVQLLDLGGLPPGEREGEARRLASQASLRGFNLEHDELLRASLFRLDDQDQVLLLVMHHIVSDGWSMGVLIRELGDLYEAFSDSRPSPLPELPIQYGDFARWQRASLQGPALKKQFDFWKEHLAGAPAILELTTDKPRPLMQTFTGAYHMSVVRKELTESLNELSRREGVTLFMTLLAAFQTLLYRYTNQEDIVVGTPIANRTRTETEDLIGFFVNTLVMRTDLSGDPSFRELVARVRENALDAFAHQDLPFEKLVEELQPERSLGHTPLFQTLFALQNAPKSTWRLGSLDLTDFAFPKSTSKLDLSLYVGERAEKLMLSFEYNTDLFEASTIERMARHFETLLEGIVDKPGERISELPLLTKREREQVLVEWNNTKAEYRRDQCLHELFAEQVEKRADQVALISETGELTYGELNRKANQLAHYLKKRGVGPEVLVGICVERSLEMVVGLLGILKAGGAYVPLDPAYPAERLRFMLEDASARLLLTQEPLLKLIPESAAEVVCLDRDWEAISRESEENPETTTGADNLAYVIYTSGSTGKPKGVAIEHRSAAALLAWAHGVFSEEELGSVLASTSICFDLSVFEIFVPLSSGGKVLLADDVLQLLSLAAAKDVKLINTVPSAMVELLRLDGLPENVQTVNLAGEPLAASLVEKIYEQGQIKRVFDLYGPSEDTTYSTWALRHRGGPATIGRPVSNTRVYLLDANQKPVPIGVPGELYLGGAGLARGYLNRPELTAKAFVPDPFSAQGTARLYKTGDLARYRADGNIEYLGRIDNQVKLRGFRIELGEIEGVIKKHPQVAEAIVLVREDEPGDKRLVAYVVPHRNESQVALPDNTWPSLSPDLQRYLQELLPKYMVPTVFVELDKIPLTPNGKMDRGALPAPGNLRSLEESFVAPRTDMEEQLASIWADVLKVNRVGINDNFFELGGHSLLATQLIARIRKSMEIDLPLRALFEAPTIRGLGEKLLTLAPALGMAGLVPTITPVPRDKAMPVSFAQQRLWFLNELEGESAFYNLPWAVRLRGALDVGSLRKAIDTIVQRHETLRTSFSVVDGEPFQVVSHTTNLAFSIADLSELPQMLLEDEARRLGTTEARQLFNLQTGPLMRVRLLRLRTDDYVLYVNMHHIVTDGWSNGIFVRELTELYESFVSGRPYRLPELPIQYADYAVWQRMSLTGELLEKQLTYWKERLRGVPPVLELPKDRPRSAVQTFRGATTSLQLKPELTKALKELSRQEGVTLFMTLLAAFQLLLSRYAGQEDIVVGSPIAGRKQEELERLIGFFVNTLMLRTDLSGNPSFRELLSRVREVTLGAYANQELPFEKLVDELEPERSLSHTPLVQVMFVLQNAPRGEFKLSGLTLTRMSVETKTSKFELTLFAREISESLSLAFEYNTDLFEASTIERMARHFETLLEGIVDKPGERISELPLLTKREREQVLVEWNNTKAEYRRDQCLHELFAEQVEKRADQVALISETGELTYGELNRKANQLAHYLKKRGVGPEVLVGICVERSLEMVVGLLGILKAGGAYVPLDPAYPAERLRFMLEDASARLLLTQEPLLKLIPESAAEVVCLDRDWEAISRESEENPETTTGADNLAYVIYTSGSTGKPKGVAIEHRSAAALLAWAHGVFSEEELGSVLASTSICFDLSVFEIFVPLSSGGKVLLADDVLQLLSLAAAKDVKLINTVPSAMVELLRLDGLPENVQTVNLAGEPLAASLVEKIYEQGQIKRVFDLYGPSEDTTYSTWALRHRGGPATIGRPVSNTRVYLLDANQKPVPIGVPGELYLGGAGLARGYLNRPELTAKAFVPDPFSAQGTARLYKTGDLARYRADGNIEYLGRIDNQVKLRGFRIELGEIEGVIKKHPQVAEAIVLVREDEPGDKRLVAYVVPHRNESDQKQNFQAVSDWQAVSNDSLLGKAVHSLQSDLQTLLTKQLPEYMKPSDFIFLDAFPVTPNGKVDRSALPAPGQSRPELEQPYIAPRTTAEKELASIWAEVLRRERVGVKDNFFEIGGHSLLATQVISRIRKDFKVELPLRSIFESPTIATLAVAVVELQQNLKPVAGPVISRRRRGISAKIDQLSPEEVDSLLAKALLQADLKQ